jgi:ribosomal protein L11 methyltransferase
LRLGVDDSPFDVRQRFASARNGPARRHRAMSYVALRFDVDAADGDAWSDALLEAGALSVDGADPFAGTADEAPVFDERVDGEPTWWSVSRLTALLAANVDATVLLARAAAIVGSDVPEAEVQPVADRDWVRATQAQFHPIRIEDDLWIVPTWRTAPNAAAVNIALDPGLAFGTGAHPSTRMCLSWLRHNVAAGCSVLDYGCGSGILAIAAARLGARDVAGVDIDAQAVAASAANARLNGVHAAFCDVDALAAGATFDVVVANILANPLRLLAPALAGRTAAGGSIALAGILVAQADGVMAAYARWFDLHAWRVLDDWVLLAGRKRLLTNAGDAQ